MFFQNERSVDVPRHVVHFVRIFLRSPGAEVYPCTLTHTEPRPSELSKRNYKPSSLSNLCAPILFIKDFIVMAYLRIEETRLFWLSWA